MPSVTGRDSFLLTGGLTTGLTLAGWDAFVLSAFSARVAVARPASLAVCAFLFTAFLCSHQIEKAAISTGVQGR